MSEQIWHQYYQEVLQLEPEAIRPGSEPRLMNQGKKVENAIVLLHGLSDSPFYMNAIGHKFYEMGFNVLLPLFPAHGLQDSQLAEKSFNSSHLLDRWKEAVNYAVSQAKTMGNKVSIGGLSMGGTLSLYHALTYPHDINGGLFLFSAAIDLGEKREDLLNANNEFADIFKFFVDKVRSRDRASLIGENPYTYSWIPLGTIQNLSTLIEEIEKKYPSKQVRYNDLKQPLFVAHSEFDEAIAINELELLVNNHPETFLKTEFYRIKKDFFVTHARLILAENVYANETSGTKGEPLECKNPFFEDMMESVKRFVDYHLA
ncbi:phospholipase/Carboxylesterase [Rippkaea orientalis PCC 8801]|uniref:Phospholipase/Carboxylesterase n=1 Tax=Rippkaea orientalis (strain PCC 8801 / RF-1) TaxID=41431 RepID=B7K0A1_RIPO1|nr:alpha/beta hydrolase [Rippkaea orientalis]ACK67385.1 phospholipase/Carboxylesterase [Rippkaea orientalis PCC 8801]